MNWTDYWAWAVLIMLGVVVLSEIVAWVSNPAAAFKAKNERLHRGARRITILMYVLFVVTIVGGIAVNMVFMNILEGRAETTLARQLEVNAEHIEVKITGCSRTKAGSRPEETWNIFAPTSPCVAWSGTATLTDGRVYQISLTATNAEILSGP